MNYWIIPGVDKARTLDELIKRIAYIYQIKIKDMERRTRVENIVNARRWFYFFAFMRKMGSLNDIALYTNQDHSTVLYHYRKVNNLLRFDKEYKTTYNELKGKL